MKKTDVPTNEQIYVLTNGKIDEPTHETMDVLTNENMDEPTNEKVDVLTDGKRMCIQMTKWMCRHMKNMCANQ